MTQKERPYDPDVDPDSREDKPFAKPVSMVRWCDAIMAGLTPGFQVWCQYEPVIGMWLPKVQAEDTVICRRLRTDGQGELLFFLPRIVIEETECQSIIILQPTEIEEAKE